MWFQSTKTSALFLMNCGENPLTFFVRDSSVVNPSTKRGLHRNLGTSAIHNRRAVGIQMKIIHLIDYRVHHTGEEAAAARIGEMHH